ncbi:hypothetical protein PS726_03021 [Pseudomonas fluorescens]|nr:hypothetical protein PS726_03021 [Pseudomonas fluorescens]
MRSRMVLKARPTSTTSLPPPSATGSTSAPSDRSRAARARRLSGRLCQCTSRPMNNSKKLLVRTMNHTCCAGRPCSSRLV